jgi:hypothetical protein
LLTIIFFVLGTSFLVHESWEEMRRLRRETKGSDDSFGLTIRAISGVRVKALLYLFIPIAVGLLLDEWIGVPLKDLLMGE